jgi:hypothetical protein
MQLRTVSETLRGIITCPQLDQGLSDPLVEQLLDLSGRVTSGLQSLVSFRDSFSSYDRLMGRLKAWLQRAEGKMDGLSLAQQSTRIHPYDFWELKAQLESQAPLRNEATILLDQSLRGLQVTDSPGIRANFANFDDRWNSLLSSVASTEEQSLQLQLESGGDGGDVSAKLQVMGGELEDMAEIISSMRIQVESEDELYLYLEKLQVLFHLM